MTFLEHVATAQSPEPEIQVILDTLSTHKTALVKIFLEQHPNVRFHFTPTEW